MQKSNGSFQNSFSGENETWKDIPKYDNYEASDLGNIRNKLTGTVRKFRLTNWGYLKVKILGKHLLVHRLIALTFIQNNDPLKEVNHKNMVKTDNRVVNLEWVTKSENVKHSFKNGRIPIPTTLGKKGILCHASKPVIAIKEMAIYESETRTYLGKLLGIKVQTIKKFIDSGTPYKGFCFYSI